MRLVVGTALIDRGVARLWSAHPIQVIIVCVLETGTGALLLAGLWTPVAGTLVAAIEMWKIFLHPGDPLICILLGTLGAALAMLGPGAWSVDARLFGWKRIDLPTRKS
jgi:putative oxidoreductase